MRPVVGRSAEIDLLREQLAGAVATGRRTILVSGEAGIGKTALVDRFTADVRYPAGSANVARGLCVPMGEAGVAFAPVLGVLRSLEDLHGLETIAAWAGGGRAALSSLVPELREATDPPDPAHGLQLRMFEAVARVVRRSSEVRPLIVLVEDVHWADSSSAALLQFLARTVTDVPLLLLLTHRTDESPAGGVQALVTDLSRLPGTTRLPLPRLDRASVAEMLRVAGGPAVTAARIDHVHRRSQGVPFYVRELAATSSGGAATPELLREVVAGRLRRLPDDARPTVALAAVAGVRVQHELIVAAVEEPQEVEQQLRAAVEAGVLDVEGEEYVFRHALYAEALYDDLLPGERSRIHARVAAALERRPELAPGMADHAIAVQWGASGDAPRSFSAAVRATRTSSVAHAESLAMYERVLGQWAQVEDPEGEAGPLVGVLTEAARVARDVGEYDRALELVSEALGLEPGGDTGGRADRLLLRALLLTDSLRPGADADLEAAEELLAAITDDAVRAPLLGRAATLRLNIGAVSLAVAMQAVDAARSLDDSAVEAEARITLGTALVAECREDDAVAELQRAVDLPRIGGHARLRGLLNLSDALHLRGDYGEAVRVALAGLAEAAEHGMERSFGTYLAGNAAESMLATGEWAPAADLIAEAVALDPPSSHRTHLELLLAWLHTMRGEEVAAEEILREHRHLIGEDQPAPQFALQMARVDSENAVLFGDPERAWRNLRPLVLGDPNEVDVTRTWPLIPVAAAAATALDGLGAAGRRESVRALIDRAKPTRTGSMWRRVAEAELDDSREGWALLVETLGEAPAPAHLAPYARLRLAEHLSAARERAALRREIDEASEAARTIGARLLVDRLAELGRRAGVAAPGEAPAQRSGLPALTARENDVLGLVVLGLSNKQIGERLYISTKTASVHVSNILAKLGVGGRTEAAAIAVQHGLGPVEAP